MDVKRAYKSNTFEVGVKTSNNTVLEQELSETFKITPANFKTLNNELKLNIQISENQTPNDLLNYLTSKGEVSHFVELIPSVNDIFIQTVTHNNLQ